MASRNKKDIDLIDLNRTPDGLRTENSQTGVHPQKS